MTTYASTTPGPLDAETVRDLDRQLAEVEEARAAQLAAIEDPTDDLTTEAVTAAYQETVRTILAEVRLARRRLADGTYGACTRCHGPIAPERLEWRPWATTCIDCAKK